MVKQLSPCKDCKDRYMACWDGCEKYKEWKEAYSKQKDTVNDLKIKEYNISKGLEDMRQHMMKNRASNKFK